MQMNSSIIIIKHWSYIFINLHDIKERESIATYLKVGRHSIHKAAGKKTPLVLPPWSEQPSELVLCEISFNDILGRAPTTEPTSFISAVALINGNGQMTIPDGRKNLYRRDGNVPLEN